MCFCFQSVCGGVYSGLYLISQLLLKVIQNLAILVAIVATKAARETKEKGTPQKT